MHKWIINNMRSETEDLYFVCITVVYDFIDVFYCVFIDVGL